jgi:hypothetical protein
MPVYLLRITPSATAEVVERLVKAPNQARALRKVTDDSIEIAEAEPDAIHRLAKAGVEIEVAAAEGAAS